jgi:hypothetical protein
MTTFTVGLDLGQSQDFTAICVLERVPARCAVPSERAEDWYEFHVRHLERPALGTRYPAIVERVRTLLDTPPLTMRTPLVVDRTGVGAAVTDMFPAAGLWPHAVTITGGDAIVRDGPLHTKVPKREWWVC